MSTIVRWFEDFPNRALDLMRQIEPIAAGSDRIGSFALLVAPALITTPYERLQTYARRKNPQADYLRFPDAHQQFDRLMLSPFGEAALWTAASRATIAAWRCSRVVSNIATPHEWQTTDGRQPSDGAFWSDDILGWETRRVWKRSAIRWHIGMLLRPTAITATSTESGIMEQFLLYRSNRDTGPWDVIAVSPDAFFSFLKSWAEFLGHGLAHEVLVASAAE